MHLRATNISTQTPDVHRFGFEPAGAIEFTNEYSGLAVAPDNESVYLKALKRRGSPLLNPSTAVKMT